jgi:hypothetical protein
MDCDELGRPLSVLLPKLLEFFAHANEPFRRYALGSVNQFLLSMPAALTAILPQYLQVRCTPPAPRKKHRPKNLFSACRFLCVSDFFRPRSSRMLS